MRLIEDRALRNGLTVDRMMETFAQQIAEYVYAFSKKSTSPPPVLFLCGKGNNGADAYTTGIFLLQKNITCFAMQVGDCKENSLLENKRKGFIHQGGKIVSYDSLHNLPNSLIIVDGIYGAGFKGIPDPSATKAILFANAHGGLIIAIDIPSGVDPSTGEVLGEAIFADYTIACQYPKTGCFLTSGFDHCGKILCATICIPELPSNMTLIEETDLFSLVPRLKRTQDKFQSGVVIGIGGSSGMSHAAIIDEYISIFPDGVGKGLCSGSSICFWKATYGSAVLMG